MTNDNNRLGIPVSKLASACQVSTAFAGAPRLASRLSSEGQRELQTQTRMLVNPAELPALPGGHYRRHEWAADLGRRPLITHHREMERPTSITTTVAAAATTTTRGSSRYSHSDSILLIILEEMSAAIERLMGRFLFVHKGSFLYRWQMENQRWYASKFYQHLSSIQSFTILFLYVSSYLTDWLSAWSKYGHF